MTHRYTTPGVYTAVLRLTNDTQAVSSSRRITVVEDIPLVADAGDDRVVASGTSASFTGNDSEPIPGIESFDWTFSDTQHDRERSRRQPPVRQQHGHARARAGDAHGHAGVGDGHRHHRRHRDAGHRTGPRRHGRQRQPAGLAGAALTVVDGRGVRYQASTNAAGVGTIYGLPDGAFTVYAFADGYQPATGSATVASGTGALTMTLSSGAVGSTVLESRRLTYEEIIEAGIDPRIRPTRTSCTSRSASRSTGHPAPRPSTATPTARAPSSGVGSAAASSAGRVLHKPSCYFTLPDGRSVSGTVTFVEDQPVGLLAHLG